MGLAADGRGHVFVADDLNETVRQIDLATGVVSTIAGQPVVPGSSDGVGGAAHFHYPFGVAADCAGDVFVADSYNDAIRRVNVPSGRVDTIVGVEGATGVRAGALPAQISHPSALALLPSVEGLLIVSENAVLLAR
jgi:streptogramin lyase